MKKIIIGVIARKNKLQNGKTFIGAYANYLKKIINAGGTPIIIPEYDYDDLKSVLKMCDGILAPGGDDITDFDKYIYEYARKYDIPYLGICLGMQAMTNGLEKVKNHYLTNHKVYLSKSSKLYKIYNSDEIFVNSRHKFKIKDPKGLNITAYSNDDVIEGLEDYNKKFIVGVEWHPEDLEDSKLFEEFIKSCI